MNNELVLFIPKVCHPELDKYERNVWAEDDKNLDDWKWLMRFAIGKNLGQTGKFSHMLVEYYFNDSFPRTHADFQPLYIKNGLELWGVVGPDVKVEWKIILGAEEKKTVIILSNSEIHKSSGKVGHPGKHPISTEAHEAIRKVYFEDTGGGQVRDLAKRLGIPRWKISRYAIQQGWIAKQHKEPDWNENELKILEHNAHLTPEVIQRKLKEHGFIRTATGIVLKRKRTNFIKNLSGQSATSLAVCLGVDNHFVTKAIEQGRLKAERRGTKRTPQQGGDSWYIKDGDIKNYIRENVHEIDFRKIDKYWLVGLLS